MTTIGQTEEAVDLRNPDEVAVWFIIRSVRGGDVRPYVADYDTTEDGSSVLFNKQPILDIARDLARLRSDDRPIVNVNPCEEVGDSHFHCEIVQDGAARLWQVYLSLVDGKYGVVEVVPGMDTGSIPSTPGGASGGPTYFRSPSGNIGCQLSTTEARCDIRERDWQPPPQPADCDLDWGNAIVVSSGAGTFSCAGDTVFTDQATDLPYGQSLSLGTFTCTSAENGVSCRNSTTGHGFRIARGTYELV